MSHQENTQLLKALMDCVAECNHCFNACLEEDDVKMLAQCIRLDRDCADICQLTYSLISRGSVHGMHLLEECTEICLKCAEECEKHKHMDHCRICADACRSCAEECRREKVHAHA